MAVDLPNLTAIQGTDLISNGPATLNGNFNAINQPSSETQAGLAQIGDAGELLAGTDPNKVPSLLGLTQRINATDNVAPKFDNQFDVGTDVLRYTTGNFVSSVMTELVLDGASVTVIGGVMYINGDPVGTGGGGGAHRIEDSTIHNVVNATPTSRDMLSFNAVLQEWAFVRCPITVNTIAPADGEALVYDAGAGLWDAGSVASSLSALTDVDIIEPQAVGETLIFNGENFINSSVNLNIPKLTYIQANPGAGILPVVGETSSTVHEYDQDVINETTDFQGDIESCQGLLIEWRVEGTGGSVTLEHTLNPSDVSSDVYNFAFADGGNEYKGMSILPWEIGNNTFKIESTVTGSAEYDFRVIAIIYTRQGTVAPGFGFTYAGGNITDANDYADINSTPNTPLPYFQSDFLNGPSTPVTGWGSVFPLPISPKVSRSKISYQGFDGSTLNSEIIFNIDWLSLSAQGYYNFYDSNRFGEMETFDNSTGLFTYNNVVGTAPAFEMTIGRDQSRALIAKLPAHGGSPYHSWSIDNYTIDNVVSDLVTVFNDIAGTITLNENNSVNFVMTDVDLPAILATSVDRTISIKNESGGSITIASPDANTDLNGTTLVGAGATIEYAAVFDRVNLSGEWRELRLNV